VRKALQNLIIIYQQERDWEACLRVSEELEPLVNESFGLARSHYYCELAEEALRKKHPEEAATLLKQAVRAEPECVRPTHLQARMAMESGDCRKAIDLLHTAVEQDRSYLPEVSSDLHSCHAQLDDLAGLRRYLEGFLDSSTDVAVVLVLTDLILEMEGEAAASVFISEQMEQHPTIRGLLRLIELNSSLPDVKAGQILVGLKDHMERLLAERPAYQCTRCGYSANTMHWQCPSCRSWSTLRRKNEPEDKRR